MAIASEWYILCNGRRIYHGEDIEGTINGQHVLGVLSINGNSTEHSSTDPNRFFRAFFCQNIFDGSRPNVLFNHSYGWAFNVNTKGIPNEGVTIINQTSAPTGTNPKPMTKTIKNIFKSKVDKALEYFGFGTSCELNDLGRDEFLDYILETSKTDKDGFFTTIVEAYEKEKAAK
jgi:hypothetical protein